MGLNSTQPYQLQSFPYALSPIDVFGTRDTAKNVRSNFLLSHIPTYYTSFFLIINKGKSIVLLVHTRNSTYKEQHESARRRGEGGWGMELNVGHLHGGLAHPMA